MRTTIIFILLCIGFGSTISAQNKTSDFVGWQPPAATNAVSDCVTLPDPTPTRRILPEEIEQGSIKMDQFYTPGDSNTNKFVVRFAYTEAGAKKMLAFRREHAGHEVITQVGNFECRSTMSPLERRPVGWTEEGWLKRRTAKFLGVSEDDAKKIVEGLKKK